MRPLTAGSGGKCRQKKGDNRGINMENRKGNRKENGEERSIEKDE